MASRRPAGSAPEAGRISTTGGTHCPLMRFGMRSISMAPPLGKLGTRSGFAMASDPNQPIGPAVHGYLAWLGPSRSDGFSPSPPFHQEPTRVS